MTRPSYDPMRAPAPRFPRHRFARIHDEDRVAELEEAYERLSYADQVRFSRDVTQYPDEQLGALSDRLSGAEASAEPPADTPVPSGDAEAARVNQEAAQVNPEATAAVEPAPTPPPAEETPQVAAAAQAAPASAPAPDAPADAAPAAPAAAPAAEAPADAPTPDAPAPAEATAVPAPEPAAPAPEPAAAEPVAEPAPAAPAVPPADQLPQMKVPELQALAEDVGVAKSGTKAELVERITAATGEQPAITPEQVAADAASTSESADALAAQEDTTTPAAPADGAATDGGQP